jgi:hypothetical protein
LALAAAGAVALLSLDVRSPSLAVVTGAPGVVLVLVLGAALILARPGWIGAILALLALLFFSHLAVAGESSPQVAAIVGVALLLAGELSQWSIDERLAGRYESGIQVSRAIGIAWLGLLGLAVELLCLLAVGLPVTAGIETLAVGMAAAVALLGLFSAVAARAPTWAPTRSGRRDAA